MAEQETPTPDLNWWTVRDARDFLIGRVSRFAGMGPGWERVLTLGRDANARPHDSVPADLLLLECREMAEILVQIVREDGHTLTLAECLRTIICDTAARSQEAQDSGVTS